MLWNELIYMQYLRYRVVHCFHSKQMSVIHLLRQVTDIIRWVKKYSNLILPVLYLLPIPVELRQKQEKVVSVIAL